MSTTGQVLIKEKKEKGIKALIVSRHKSTTELLKGLLEKHGIPYDVIDHIDDPNILKDYYIVLGNLPITIFEKVQVPYYIQVSLNIPKELRGKELGIEELKKYIRYVVFQHIITFKDWYPRDAYSGVVEYDIWFVKDIDKALEWIKSQ